MDICTFRNGEPVGQYGLLSRTRFNLVVSGSTGNSILKESVSRTAEFSSCYRIVYLVCNGMLYNLIAYTAGDVVFAKDCGDVYMGLAAWTEEGLQWRWRPLGLAWLAANHQRSNSFYVLNKVFSESSISPTTQAADLSWTFHCGGRQDDRTTLIPFLSFHTLEEFEELQISCQDDDPIHQTSIRLST